MPEAPRAPATKKAAIEFILIPAGWVRIDVGSFTAASPSSIADVAPWAGDDEPWYLCTSEGRQIIGRCATIAAVKYTKDTYKP